MCCSDPAPLVELAREWNAGQATRDITGYMGMRVLADRDDPGSYIVIADFGVIDPEVSAADEARRHNDRPETPGLGRTPPRTTKGNIEYRHYDDIYRTDPIAANHICRT